MIRNSSKTTASISAAIRIILTTAMLPSLLSATGAASTITIKAGQSIQSAVNNHPAGTTFLISAGVYRQQSVVPKSGDSFIGENGAHLNGSAIVSRFSHSGTLWGAHLNVSPPKSLPGKCFSSSPMCAHPEDLYFDGSRFSRVTSKNEVVSNKWFLDYASGTVYLADNPTGHTVEVTMTRFAFSGSASNVTIQGLIIEKYGNFAQHGAVISIASSGAPGRYWVVEKNEIRYNHGPGITGSLGMKILSNYIHHNGQIGISTSGDNLLVSGNEISNNNTDGFAFGWEAGGAKFSLTSNLVVSYNNVHDNYGAGLHTDINNYNTLYEYNQTARNKVAGIYHEISFNAVIRYNTVVNDGYTPYGRGIAWGAGIFTVSSPDVEVYGNTVSDCMNGIIGVQYQIRPGGAANVLKNYYAHDNTVKQGTGVAAGIGDLTGTGNVYTANNHYRNDTYKLSSGSSMSFHWKNRNNIDKQTWNGYNQD